MTIREIAEWLGGEVVGSGIEARPEIERVAKIEDATTGCLSFLANPKYEKHLDTTNATAVLVSRKLDLKKYEGQASCVFIRVDDPYLSFLQMLKRLSPSIDPFTSGIHPTAVVSPHAVMGNHVSVGAYAVVGDDAVVGENSKIGEGCIIGKHAQIGSDCLLYPHVVVYHQCVVGRRVILHSGAVIGSDGFGFAPKPDGTYEKIPQMGIAVIEDDVEIGANTTIDRAVMGDTRIHRGVKIDNLVQIAHNVSIGEHTVIAAQAGISGSTKIGAHCMIGGQVGVSGHIEIADHTALMAQSGIHFNIKEPGKSYFGSPADEARKAQRSAIAVKMLPEMLREFTALKNKVAELEQRLSDKQ
ncbi:MAG: UDP-3-O-(3-hydroxymyristoyl)glucosamine N-acyltransferase [Ignavibacteriae bacterium]|nr:MAG: UDP-3-O-(3-hydroxymyristoyl)glucosamine N-acyltransferase [Ignavibacteriota bacterium]